MRSQKQLQKTIRKHRQLLRKENQLRQDDDFMLNALFSQVATRKTKRCEVCDKDVLTTSNARHMKSKAHLNNMPRKQIPKLQDLVNQRLNDMGLKNDQIETEINRRRPNPFQISLDYEVNIDSSSLKYESTTLSVIGEYDNDIDINDINQILYELVRIYRRLINQNMMKYYLNFQCKFYHDNEERIIFIPFGTKQLNDYSNANNIENELQAKIEELEHRDSGLVFETIACMKVKFYKIAPLTAGSYKKLPFNSKSILNIKNNDKKCLVWCILAHKHPADKNQDRLTHYKPFENEIDMTGIDYPVKLKDIPKIESMNNIKINVYNIVSFNKEWILDPMYSPPENDINSSINIGFYDDHYVLITKIRSFGKSKINKNFMCNRCFSSYSTANCLGKHLELCMKNDAINMRFPKEQELKFDKFHYKINVPFRITADFEAYNHPVDIKKGTIERNIEQKPAAVGFRLISDIPELLKPQKQKLRSKDCVEWFLNELFKIEKRVSYIFGFKIPMDLDTVRDSVVCWMCHSGLTTDRVRDHDHLTGKFRGMACNDCNLKAQDGRRNFIPVLFHNYSNYDSHLFFEELYQKAKEKKLKFKVLAQTDERYISVQVGCLRFLDSYRFLPESLDKLSSGLKEFKFIKDPLLIKKLAYPYDLPKSIEDYDKILLSDLTSDGFYSVLKDSKPDQEEINRTFEIIDKYKLKTLGDLTDIYLENDIDLLADVIENFIEVSVKEFGINPLYCYSLPGFTWLCGLKYSTQGLQYLKDGDIIRLIENNIRGGISSIMGPRLVFSNNYQKVIYIDANNLYGWSMSQPLPYGDIQHMRSIPLDSIMNTADDSEVGYFVEVDLKYPREIKEKTKYFPFAPVKRKVEYSELSEYQKSVNANGSDTEKLVCDQLDKKNYLCHYRLLKFYVSQGMIIEKVHRVISFKQSKWLEKYIDLNTRKRANAQTDFEKDFFKLLNNSFYGKTLENIRNRIEVIFRDKNCDSKIKEHSKVNFKYTNDKFKNFDAYHYKKNNVTFDKPIYLGFAILELSKLHMYKTYYEVLQPYFKEANLKLHYHCTDSFVLSFKTDDLTQDLKNLSSIFDFSNLKNYPEIFDKTNEKVLGKFKIETPNGLYLHKFIALRAKAYSFVENLDSSPTNKLKGISKVQTKKITFDDYYDCLMNFDPKKPIQHTNISLQSDLHKIYISKIKKNSLSPSDTKRYYINNIENVPFGYYV